ncbi:hypothetical protein O1M63_47110 [Streptomyces mirabilis]|nr:hypothetical protein [Streptomyces mirabilis]
MTRYDGIFDAMADFDAAVRDSDVPDRIRPAFDSGDHPHFNDAGLRAMADAIDLTSTLTRFFVSVIQAGCAGRRGGGKMGPCPSGTPVHL